MVNHLVLGILEFHNCPCEPLLPLFLTLNGAALLLKCVLQGTRIMFKIAPPDGERHCLYTVTDMLTLFLLFWGFTGKHHAHRQTLWSSLSPPIQANSLVELISTHTGKLSGRAISTHTGKLSGRAYLHPHSQVNSLPRFTGQNLSLWGFSHFEISC